MIIAYLISKSAVQYMKHFIYHFELTVETFCMTSNENIWQTKTKP